MGQHFAITDVLSSLDLKVLTVERTVAGAWWNFESVVSPFSRLWLVMGGGGTVKHHDRTFKLHSGCLHLVPAFTPHDCFCPSRLDHFHLHFLSHIPAGIDLFSLVDCEWQVPAPPEFGKLIKQLERIYPDRKLPCYDPARKEYRQFSTMGNRMENETSPSEWMEAQAILRYMLTPFLKSARMREGIHSGMNHHFLAVLEFIHKRMHEQITLGNLARVAGLNPTYFSTRFEQIVGVRPLEYLARQRMERAQHLLLTSRLSIKQICFEIGLRDPAYFTRVFLKYYHLSPSAYRAVHNA